MADHTTLKRDGGWTIELLTPIDGLKELNIRSPTLDHTIRWGRHEIHSVLGLLAELSGVPEPLLRKLSGADADRVLTAFSLLAPPLIQEDFKTGRRPLATPDDMKTEEQKYHEQMLDNDPNDPRFPRVAGEMVGKFKDRTPPAPAAPEEAGMDIDAPEAMRRVG